LTRGKGREGAQGEVVGKQLDLADLKSISKLIQELKGEPRIDYLILNAGIMSPKLEHDSKGWESNLATNHYGHYALVQGLFEKLKAQACSP
jgi:NAD(P)-dependent dehydrogenase (short-subunit alcohol dehydrogenase family)